MYFLAICWNIPFATDVQIAGDHHVCDVDSCPSCNRPDLPREIDEEWPLLPHSECGGHGCPTCCPEMTPAEFYHSHRLAFDIGGES